MRSVLIVCGPICFVGLVALIFVAVFPIILTQRSANAEPLFESILPSGVNPSTVTVERLDDNLYEYFVNERAEAFIGMGYNPIYRFLTDEERGARYDRDFALLCQAGVNHIVGWDHDKGYAQDKFDEVTLDYAFKHGLGVVMPIYLPHDGNYEDEAFLDDVRQAFSEKVVRYRDHPALRMWGVGNEVLTEMPPEMWGAFLRFYLEFADMIHELDPNHPVIYREAEDTLFLIADEEWQIAFDERPWLLYGMNVYTFEIERLIEEWPFRHDRPLFVTEFGSRPFGGGDRALGYLSMWEMIRSHPNYVIGGAAYAWTTEGAEPTDAMWGLMDGESQPVDDAFEVLAERWRAETTNSQCQ